jgi:GDPmannose 4,6-dehydratase
MKKALITGIAGQDGSYLAELLLKKGYDVYGIEKLKSAIPTPLLNRIKHCYEVDLKKPLVIRKIIQEIAPDEIYHLAAHHFSSQKEGNKWDAFEQFYLINQLTTNLILDVIKHHLDKCHLFYASSCQVFGRVDSFPQNESTAFRPDSFYSISKVAGTNLCQFYREHYGIYATVGILYNHESVRRSLSFVTAQIAESAAKASLGKSEKLVLKDINARVDWGAAQDYVNAMWLTLQQDGGDDYIIASGVLHTVSEFAKIAFATVGLDSNDYVFQDVNVKTTEKLPYVGDASKITNTCNWHPVISFNDLVKEMVYGQIERLHG